MAKRFCLFKFVEPDSENSTNSRKGAFLMRRGISMPKYRSTILLVCLLAIGGLTGFAQSNTGRLIGVIGAADGAVSGATVVVKDNKTGKERAVTTNEEASSL